MGVYVIAKISRSRKWSAMRIQGNKPKGKKYVGKKKTEKMYKENARNK